MPLPPASVTPLAPPSAAPALRALALLSGGVLLLAGCATGESSDASSAAPATVTVTADSTREASSSAAADEAASEDAGSAASSADASATDDDVATESTAASASDEDAPGAAETSSASDSESDSRASGAAAVSAEDRARVDELADVLLPAEDSPSGAFTDLSTQTAYGQPASMYVTLTGVTPTGRCAELIDELNETETDALGETVGQYELDPDALLVEGPANGAVAATTVTAEDADLMAPYGEMAEVCGTVTGAQGQKAEFTPVDGVEDAVTIEMTMAGMSEALTMTFGGASEGDEHVYMGIMGLDPDLAGEILRAQVDRFEAR